MSRVVVVLKEHSVLGELGSAIAEIASEFAPVRILRVGVLDRFSDHCGIYEYLLKEHGLDRPAIEQRMLPFSTHCSHELTLFARRPKIVVQWLASCGLSGRYVIADFGVLGVVESFFASLKKQAIYGARLTTREKAKQLVFAHIELYYN